MQCRNCQYSCNQNKPDQESSLEINIIKEPFLKQHRPVCLTVISMEKSGCTECSKRHRTSEQCSFACIPNHKSNHSHYANRKSFCHNLSQKISGQNGFIFLSWLFIHNVFSMRLQSKGNRRKTICQQIDKQQVNRSERNRKTSDGCVQNRKDCSEVSG